MTSRHPISLLATSCLALAALAFVSAPGSAAEAASRHEAHHAGRHYAKVRHAKTHPATARVRVGRRAPVPGDPGPPQGYVQGIGPVWYGDGVNGPPNGGAYTTYPTNDPSIGWFPGLWDAQRSGECIIDDGYGRWSGCDVE